MTDAQRGLRVLVVAPTPKDCRITVDILEQAGCNVAALHNIDELCAGIRTGAGAVLLTDDLLRTKECIKALASALNEQPPWSDMPIVLVSREGTESPGMSSILAPLRNVLVLKQPVHIPTLISAVKSALRSRNRQYEIRDLIEEREKSEEALARAKSELEQQVEERTAEIARRADQLQALAGELTLAEQRERIRLARILHDGLQQLLVAAKFHAATVERSRDIKKAVVEIADLLDDAIETSRSLTSELSPPVLREGGLVPATEWLVRWMRDKHGLDIRLTVRNNIDLLSEPILLLLFQAIRELLFNVVKHAFVKTAELELSMGNDQIEVSVRDEGVGFNTELLDSKRADSGGFGLFSIKERLSIFGGRLEIASSPGSGSVFRMLVPASAAKTNTLPPKPEKAREVVSASRQRVFSGAKDKIRVVLVDDHIVMRQGIARLIDSEPDLEVVGEAPDGASAVKLVTELRPDVVLMDLSMPGMNGIETTQFIHARNPEVRIIGLSMFEEREKAAGMLQAGAAEYLTKSGPADDLIRAIRKSVRSEMLKPEKPSLK